MSISNPVKRGYCEERVQFTYKGGNKLFHFSPRDNNLSSSMENNIVLFADNVNQARATLKEMFLFMMQSSLSKEQRLLNRDFVNDKEFALTANGTYKRFREYLINVNIIKIVEAPMNQIYVVGWADNDELH